MKNKHYPALAELMQLLVDNSRFDFIQTGFSAETANQVREEINNALQIKQAYTDRILELEHVKAVCNDLQAKCDEMGRKLSQKEHA